MNESGLLIYVGPSFDQIVRNGASFRGGVPSGIRAIIKKYPFINELIVPSECLAQSKKAIRKSGSYLNMLYRKAEKIRRK